MTTGPVQLPPDIEQRLQAKAVSAGLTLESYLRRLAERDAVNGTHPASTPTNPLGLEQWEGTVFGPLSREEIYEDVG